MARLQAALKYVQAAPAEMCRHRDMAHEAAQHGDRLVSLLARTPTTMLRGQLDAALTHQVRAMRALEEQALQEPDGQQHQGGHAALRELKAGSAALEKAVLRVRELEQGLIRVVGDMQGELTALRASSQALARSGNVDAAEEFAARARRAFALDAYGEWGMARSDHAQD